jgi:hypothetical protein
VKETIADLCMLFEYAIDVFQPFIEQINFGKLNHEEALKLIHDDIEST